MKKEETLLEPRRQRTRPTSRRLRLAAAARARGTMKAAAIDRFGPPSVLKAHTMPIPEPGPNEVLIALHTAGVGVWDADIRKGWWPAGKPKFPIVLGTDGTGVVKAKGAKVRRLNIGDPVWAFEFTNPKGGFYAEYVTVNANHAGRIPKRLNFLQAGAVAVTGLTALQGIDNHLRVRKGETVLIFGASGAVGSLAVQFAKRRGARVIGTARSTDAATLVRKLGADKVIDPSSPDAVEQLRKYAPNGINAVLALAGGEALERFLALVRPGGRVVYPNGVEPKPKRRAKIKLMSYDAETNPREFTRLGRAVEEARLKVPIAATFALSDIAKAHQRIERGHVLGRIVLKIR